MGFVWVFGVAKISDWWRVKSKPGGPHGSMCLTERMGLCDAGRQAKQYKHGAATARHHNCLERHHSTSPQTALTAASYHNTISKTAAMPTALPRSASLPHDRLNHHRQHHHHYFSSTTLPTRACTSLFHQCSMFKVVLSDNSLLSSKHAAVQSSLPKMHNIFEELAYRHPGSLLSPCSGCRVATTERTT